MGVAPGEIHVWSIPAAIPSEPATRLQALLSDDERARAARFKFERDRCRFIAARAALRILLGRYLHIPGEEISFEYGPKGKPYLRSTENPERLQFNVSHSGELALMAFCAGEELGVDLELVREMDDAADIARRFFCPSEVDRWMSLPEELRLRGFFNCWTRKEAYVKAVGGGLSIPLDGFEVSFRPGDPPAILLPGSEHWSLFDVSPTPGYAAALAIRGSGWTVDSKKLEHPHRFRGLS